MTVVCTFDELARAESAREALVADGFDPDAVRVTGQNDEPVRRRAGAVLSVALERAQDRRRWKGSRGGSAPCGSRTAEDLARPAGIEPATPAFGGQYSIH